MAKYFVWGSGAWRELELRSGRVSGWRRRARFVFVRRGRLVVARRRAVLRALRALAAGHAGAAADGPRLAHRSASAARRTSAELAPACLQHHCCALYNGHVAAHAQPSAVTREAAVQCSPRAHALTIAAPARPAPARPAPAPTTSEDEVLIPRVSLAARSPATAADALLSGRRRAGGAARAGAGGAGGGVCKELLIPESDVSALRGFVSRTRASALPRFDDDDDYKRALFYAINPLVEIERCSRLENALREHFAAQLGLACASPAGPAGPVSPASRGDTDKENRAAPAPTAGRTAGARRSLSPKRVQGVSKEYSSLEDQVIVAWVSAGSRAARVNGNAVWRQLEEQYARLAGRRRSWHSLRNRYLRYILPGLAALHVAPGLAARLRSAAASKRSHVRSSFFKEVSRIGASSRARPFRPAHTTDDEEEEEEPRHHASPSPVLLTRRSARAAPRGEHSARTPRYSEVTRRFADRHEPSSGSSAQHEQPARNTRPAQHEQPARHDQHKAGPRSRKLFNPNI